MSPYSVFQGSADSVQGHSACWIPNAPVNVTFGALTLWQMTKDIIWVKGYHLIEQTLLLVRMGLDLSYITGLNQGRVCAAIHKPQLTRVTGSCWCKWPFNKYMCFFIIVRPSIKLWKRRKMSIFISYVRFFSHQQKTSSQSYKSARKSQISNKKMTYGISVELHINAPSCFKWKIK